MAYRDAMPAGPGLISFGEGMPMGTFRNAILADCTLLLKVGFWDDEAFLGINNVVRKSDGAITKSSQIRIPLSKCYEVSDFQHGKVFKEGRLAADLEAWEDKGINFDCFETSNERSFHKKYSDQRYLRLVLSGVPLDLPWTGYGHKSPPSQLREAFKQSDGDIECLIVDDGRKEYPDLEDFIETCWRIREKKDLERAAEYEAEQSEKASRNAAVDTSKAGDEDEGTTESVEAKEVLEAVESEGAREEPELDKNKTIEPAAADPDVVQPEEATIAAASSKHGTDPTGEDDLEPPLKKRKITGSDQKLDEIRKKQWQILKSCGRVSTPFEDVSDDAMEHEALKMVSELVTHLQQIKAMKR